MHQILPHGCRKSIAFRAIIDIIEVSNIFYSTLITLYLSNQWSHKEMLNPTLSCKQLLLSTFQDEIMKIKHRDEYIQVYIYVAKGGGE